MGEGVKCYATMLYNNKLTEEEVLDALLKTASFLSSQGIEVVRRKIERVIFDDRSKLVTFKCEGGCVECHLDDLNE